MTDGSASEGSSGDQLWCTASGTVDGIPVTLRLGDDGLTIHAEHEETARAVPLHAVTGIDAQIGLLTGYLILTLGAETITVARVPKARAHAFVEALRAQLRHRPAAPEPMPAPTPAVPDPSPLAELERLGRLREAGVLSDEEFENAKRILLGRL